MYTAPTDLDDDRPRPTADDAVANALDVTTRRDAPRTAGPLPNDVGPPTVQVTIGRVEVRATVEAPPVVERPEPALSLDDYLAGFVGRP